MIPPDLLQSIIRIDPSLLAKLRYVTKYHVCSANRKVEMPIKEHVEEFEQTHEEVEL